MQNRVTLSQSQIVTIVLHGDILDESENSADNMNKKMLISDYLGRLISTIDKKF